MINKKITSLVFSILILLLVQIVLGGPITFVNVAIPENKTYFSPNLILDFNIKKSISSASYSLNKEKNVPMNPVLIFSMENITGTTVTDFSPYANNGQMINNVVYNPNGKYGGALVFDGYNSYINVPDSKSLEVSKAFTISAWIYPKAKGTWVRILEKPGSYFLVFNDAADQQIRFGFYDNNNFLYQIDSNTSIPLNQWTHVAGTYDGTAMRIYVNGVEENRFEWLNLNINKTTSPLLIGSDATAAYTFNGMIDEVRVYNTSLTLRPWVSVLNSNFEEPTASDLDPRYQSQYFTNYWRTEPCVDLNLTEVKCNPHFSWDTSVYRSPNHSMKIVNTNYDDLAWLAQNPNRFKPDVVGGRTYTEQVWIKTANMSSGTDQGVRLLHLWWNSAWQNFASHYCNYTTKNYTSWTKITCIATAPIGAVKGDFVIELYGRGVLWIDDANFTSSQPMPNWINKGSDAITVYATDRNRITNTDNVLFTVA